MKMLMSISTLGIYTAMRARWAKKLQKNEVSSTRKQ